MQVNNAMQNLLDSQATGDVSPLIPTELLLVCTGGFMQEGSCVFLENLYGHKGNGTRDQFPDDVGYECFVNHFHVDEFSRSENLRICLSLIDVLKKAWLTYPRFEIMEKLRVIVSSDEDGGCVLRFHKIRPFENWLALDLNSYAMAVLVQDLP